MSRFIIILFLSFSAVNLSAQHFSFGVKLTGLSIHPKGSTNAHLMKYKFDNKGVLVFNPGIRLHFEYFFYKDIFSVKIEQGLYADCTNQFAGFSHIGLRGRIFQNDNHSFNGGIGPTFFFRRNWYKLNGYIYEFEYFNGNPEDNFQWKFIWYGGEFEYNYRINEKIELSTSIVPCVPPYIPLVLSFGLKMKGDM